MIRLALLFALLVGAAPLAAQTLTIDPHLDLPKSAIALGWTGLSDSTSQFDLERAKRGGLTAAAVALFVPQGTRDPASMPKRRPTSSFATPRSTPSRSAIQIAPVWRFRPPTCGASSRAGGSR